jgi:two-component system, NtrC family, sensor kinase
MNPEDYEAELKQLQKENRILQKKLERSEADRSRVEHQNRMKEVILKRMITEVQDAKNILESRNHDLELALDDLHQTQDKLVESEKMAALGNLVAGVAHEINTPVGTSITLASTLADETQKFLDAVQTGQLKRSILANYANIAQESTYLLLSNLNRAAELVQSFKQVAVDQASLEHRTFDLKAYLDEVIVSLSPSLKKYSHEIIVTGEDGIVIDSYPGAIAQLVTNLINNSFTHAYPTGETGQLSFMITRQPESILLEYSDDGCGIPAEHLSKVFEPFFTTARHQGGSGLGLHIVYNLVTQTLHGEIEIQSEQGEGTSFKIKLPSSCGLS